MSENKTRTSKTTVYDDEGQVIPHLRKCSGCGLIDEKVKFPVKTKDVYRSKCFKCYRTPAMKEKQRLRQQSKRKNKKKTPEERKEHRRIYLKNYYHNHNKEQQRIYYKNYNLRKKRIKEAGKILYIDELKEKLKEVK